MLRKPKNKATKLRELLERFDALPDDAIASTKVTAAVLDLSEKTVRYHPQLSRKQVSPARYGFRVGDVRKLAREGFQPIAAAAQRVVEKLRRKGEAV